MSSFSYVASNSASTSFASTSTATISPSPVAAINDVARRHNVATFVGAIGGSVGLLGVLAIGVCMSIRFRRRRSAQRERRSNVGYAEQFSAVDHGATDAEYGSNTRGIGVGPGRLDAAPVMVQAGPVPFVPRYFPGTLPSPPPYIPPADEEEPDESEDGSDSGTRNPRVAVPPNLVVAVPPVNSSLRRTNTGSYSYADRPPPTPPPESLPVFEPPTDAPSGSHPARMSPIVSTMLGTSTSKTTRPPESPSRADYTSLLPEETHALSGSHPSLSIGSKRSLHAPQSHSSLPEHSVLTGSSTLSPPSDTRKDGESSCFGSVDGPPDTGATRRLDSQSMPQKLPSGLPRPQKQSAGGARDHSERRIGESLPDNRT